MRDLLEEEAESREPRVHRIRFAVRALTNCQDPSGLPVIARNPRVFARDPRRVSDYIQAMTVLDPRHVEPFFDILDTPSTDESDGVVAHVVRSLISPCWGRAEGKQFERIAHDHSRRSYVRGWAWQSLALTPQWRADDAVDLVTSPGVHPRLARAGALALRHAPACRTRSLMLRAMESATPDLTPTTRWIDSTA
jgi:hypothetical protein